MEQENLNQEQVLEVINNFPLEPMFNKIIVTINTEEADDFLELSDNTMSEVQYVIAKGSHVQNLEVGDKVMLDLEKLIVKERNPENQDEVLTRIKIDPIFIDGVTYAIIEDRVLKLKYKR